MPYYHRLGRIPAKRHTQFKQPDDSLYKEELVSSIGFSGIYSNLYHTHSPTCVEAIEKPVPIKEGYLKDYPLQQTHLKTSGLERTGKDFLSSRLTLLKNEDVSMGLSHPSELTTDYYYKNAEADEILFLHEGEGTLYSQFGILQVREGDYIVIPRTTIYKLVFDKKVLPKIMVIESRSPVETVRRYRNKLGQLLEHSPYCERDLRPSYSTYYRSRRRKLPHKDKERWIHTSLPLQAQSF